MTGKIVVDNFAGGGGASTGIEAAIGRPCDFAINHDAEAIAMHRINHPGTQHFISNVWDVDPRKLSRGRTVQLGWFSPDCTFHSKARGGKPFRDRQKARRTRGLAWLVARWVKALGDKAPEVIMLENVEEFQDWGPLNQDGTPNKRKRGQTFRRWHSQIENLGYRIDMRELRACDYGAPTIRKRLFVIARRDGGEIVFPEAIHGPNAMLPFRTAADCIDWSIPCPSIFTRRHPLAENTMRRIARGVKRFVIDTDSPFIVPNGLAVPAIINTRNGERRGQAPRIRDVNEPYATVTAQGSQGALVMAFLAQHNTGMTGHRADKPVSSITTKGCQQQLVTSHIVKFKGTSRDGQAVDEPLHTIQAGGQHYGEVRAFLMSYYGTEQAPRIDAPAPTVRTREHLGLVMVRGEPHMIVDIGMRMFTPRELFLMQGFGRDYIIDFEHDGKPLTKTAQVRMCGNSVSPPVAKALVRANVFDREAA